MNYKIFAIFLLLIASCIITVPVLAQSGAGGNTPGVSLPNPLGDTTKTPQALIGKIINAVLGLVGSLALVMFIYGGVVWMTSAGNSSNVDKGKNILQWAAIGLVVVFASYGLVKLVIDSVV